MQEIATHSVSPDGRIAARREVESGRSLVCNLNKYSEEVTKLGSTRVLFWDTKMWYRSAIVVCRRSRQYWGCVGKVRATYISGSLHPFRHPADTKL